MNAAKIKRQIFERISEQARLICDRQVDTETNNKPLRASENSPAVCVQTHKVLLLKGHTQQWDLVT